MSTRDSDLPVLTDVLIAGAGPMQTEYGDAPLSSGGPAAADWAALQASLSESVFATLEARLDMLVEQQMGNDLDGLVEKMTRLLADELKRQLRDTVKDVVRRTVVEEVARARATGSF